MKTLYKRIFFAIDVVLLFAVSAPAAAQQAIKIPRIGFLSAAGSSSITVIARVQAFRQGLRELGYVEGKNLFVEYRYADGEQDRLKEVTAELVRLNVDVIVTGGDPVGAGFVASLARPGRNITGLSTLHPEISGKQLELLKEIIPKIARVAVFGSWTQPGNAEALRQVKAAAQELGLQLQQLEIQVTKDIDTVFRDATNARAEAILVLANPVIIYQQEHFIALAAKSRIPAVYSQPEFVDAGGLLSYTASFTDLFRRAATYVDKILKGAKPAELPVEQPAKFEFMINLRTAKQIGLTIPPQVLARADRVIR
jgi:putative tryptophan/tyrosine transport system substrate-binding protein